MSFQLKYSEPTLADISPIKKIHSSINSMHMYFPHNWGLWKE